MRKLLIITLVVLNIVLNGQNLFPETFSDCDSKEFFIEWKEIYTENLNTDLISEIINNINDKTLKKIKGEILIQVYIDTIGNPCCVSIKNDLNAKGKIVDFKQIINTQTKWTAPNRQGKNKAVSIIIKMTFNKDRIILQRLGFNMKEGLIELSRNELIKE